MPEGGEKEEHEAQGAGPWLGHWWLVEEKSWILIRFLCFLNDQSLQYDFVFNSCAEAFQTRQMKKPNEV